uniref:THAP-type domain-containing protein n=1 Tax=Sander lucioperca TaxID=283035 RepID=A0A8C9XD36_SANLU
MSSHCCVPKCTFSKRNESYTGQTFHRFPKDPVLCREWIHKIRRDPGRHFKIHMDTKVCSDHFTEESFLKTRVGMRKLKKGAVPTLFAWTDNGRLITSLKYALLKLCPSIFSCPCSAETAPPHPDHDYAELPPPLEEQLKEAHKIINDQAELIARLQTKQFLLSRFQGDKIMFFTGFPDYNTLKAVQGFSIPKLAVIDQFFLFLCRLRQGFPEQDLVVRFDVSQKTVTVSRVCVTWANYLHFMLGSLPIWPSRETVNELMPPCFQKIHVQRPSSKVLNSEIYSHYKGNTTFKGLVGISPSGLVTFVSDLYTGSISDKEITRESGILCLLEEGDEVMADKGFLIKDLLTEINVSLVIPPFLGPSGHFRLHIHVERAISRIKEYHIFDRVLPMTLVGSVNQLWTVCALLSNFQEPLF